MKKSITLSFILAATTALYATQTQIAPVVVTASKTAQSLEDVTADVSVITAEEIEERGYMTVDQVLSALAGIQVQQNGGLGKSASVRLRGMDTHRILVLIDGIRYNDPTLIGGAANFAQLLTNDIARIEVIRGPQSGIWGADASAGVINIITKRAQKEGFGATVFGEYGSFNTKKGGVNTIYKAGAFDAALSVVKLESDGFSAVAPDQANLDDYEDDGYKNTTADLKLGYQVSENDKISATLHYIDATNDYDGYDPQTFMPDPNDTKSSEDITETLARVDYRHTFSKGEANIYASRSKFKRELATGFSKNFEGSVDEVGINARYDYDKGAFVNGGIDQKRFKHENEIDRSYKNQGIFLTNTNIAYGEGNEKTIVTEVLRYDKYEDFKNKLTYQVGVKHIFNRIDDLWVSANLSSGYNIPTLYQLYSAYGNPNLNPEKTRGFDMTVSYNNLQLTFFDNRITDMIDFGPDYKYANVAGDNTFKGIELTYQGGIESLSLAYSANYTYLRAEDKDGNDLPRRAKNSASLLLDYYGIQKSHIGMEIHYTGKRKKSPYDTNPKKDDAAYTVLNLSADYQILDNLKLYARVDNLLDRTYQDISGYATSPRAFYAGFRYQVR